MSFPEAWQLADQRMTEWYRLEQGRRERARRPAKGEPRVIAVTVSREYGAGGHTIANAVAGKLGSDWQVWDREIIEKIAHDAHVRVDMARAMDEHARSWVEEVVRGLFRQGEMGHEGYHKHLVRAVLTVAQQGRKIFVGRGANLILPDALNVRLRASHETRIKRIMELESIDVNSARRRMREVDEERAFFTQKHFNRDVNDPSTYDIVISTDQLSLPTSIEVVCVAARAKLRLSD